MLRCDYLIEPLFVFSSYFLFLELYKSPFAPHLSKGKFTNGQNRKTPKEGAKREDYLQTQLRKRLDG